MTKGKRVFEQGEEEEENGVDCFIDLTEIQAHSVVPLKQRHSLVQMLFHKDKKLCLL